MNSLPQPKSLFNFKEPMPSKFQKGDDIIQFIVKSQFTLSPLAGISDLPFRITCRKFGCPFTFAEMADAEALLKANTKTFHLLDRSQWDSPVGAQIVGSNVESMVQAAQVCEQLGFDVINLNCACPVNKIKKKGKGVALMNEPPKIGEMVAKIKKVVQIPVVVKIRSGATTDMFTFAEVGKIIQEEGGSAVLIHPRSAKGKYGSELRLEHIIELKQKITIPVIASGDALDAQKACHLLEATQCDGVSVARGAMGQPWIFRDIKWFQQYQQQPPRPSLEEICFVAQNHFFLACDYLGNKGATIRMYKHLNDYFSHIKDFKDLMKIYRKKVQSRYDFTLFIEDIIQFCHDTNQI